MRYTINDDSSVTVHMQNRARTHAWSETLAPGEIERAEALLDAEALATVQDAWTDDVVAAWRRNNPDYVAPPVPEPEPPTAEERLAAIEDALLSGDETDRQRVRDNVERRRSARER